MPQKSEARHEYERIFPSAFFSGLLTSGREFDVALEDGLQVLKSVGSGMLDNCNEKFSKVQFADDIIAACKKSAETTLEYTNCSTYVLVYDKYLYVPIVKGHEQAERDSKKMNDEDSPKATKKKTKEKKPEPDRTPLDGKPFSKRRPYLERGKEVPRDIKLAIGDREDTLLHIISWLCCELVTAGSPHCIRVPKFKRVILDGHHMTLAMAKKCGIGGKYPLTDEDAYQTPILIGDPFQHSYDTSHARWCHELKNKLGEADMVAPFMINCMMKKYSHRIHAEIYSNDTDMINLCLIYLNSKADSAPVIRWRFSPHPQWVFYFDSLKTESCKWADMNLLAQLVKDGSFDRMARLSSKKSEKVRKEYEEMLKKLSTEELAVKKRTHDGERKQFLSLKQSLLSFVVAILAGKSDYTDGFRGITHERFFTAMMKYSDYIGDLVSVSDDYAYGISLNGDAYIRLIKTAYMLAWKNRFKKDNQSKDEILHPASISLEMLRKMTMSLDSKNHFLSDEALFKAAQHMRYLIILYYQVGKEPVLREPDPLNYDYHPIDQNQPLSRKNIRRGLKV